MCGCLKSCTSRFQLAKNGENVTAPTRKVINETPIPSAIFWQGYSAPVGLRYGSYEKPRDRENANERKNKKVKVFERLNRNGFFRFSDMF